MAYRTNVYFKHFIDVTVETLPLIIQSALEGAEETERNIKIAIEAAKNFSPNLYGILKDSE